MTPPVVTELACEILPGGIRARATLYEQPLDDHFTAWYGVLHLNNLQEWNAVVGCDELTLLFADGRCGRACSPEAGVYTSEEDFRRSKRGVRQTRERTQAMAYFVGKDVLGRPVTSEEVLEMLREDRVPG